MLYLLFFLLGANIFAQPSFSEFQEEVQLTQVNKDIGDSNYLFTKNYFQNFIEVYFEENFSNLNDLYDFRDTENIGKAPICVQNQNLRSPKMLYNKETELIYLLINPYIKINLSNICSNHNTETWTIPIKNDFNRQNHHYPYFKINEELVSCQSVGPRECKRLYYKTENGQEIDTKARVKISKIKQDKFGIEISGASLRLLVNSINDNSKTNKQIKLNILCYNNGEKTILDPFKETIYHLNTGETKNLNQNLLIGNYKTNCEWYK